MKRASQDRERKSRYQSYNPHSSKQSYKENSANSSSLLSLDLLTEEEWFARFNSLETQLTKLFVLIALLKSQGMITAKESS